ncbi:pfkB family kinase [Pseudovirgaria hyperparasitica]|uniref:PfkB family kinase n=1 Tax=Pseudovirgaria hyperparasitica TaxID=470096 RepID=A0A6A6WII7_9PEZI|nr:pfkB family kinase [Pseudovirgaria hyperparasitica]KAF2761900.1 pfkB family kinase [Pseudovirgaria hyperparasitica]
MMDAQHVQSEQSVLFCSLSNICLDHLVLPGKPPLIDIVGGPGGYATLGARIFAASPLSKRIGWLITVGGDFPSQVKEELESWDLSLSLKIDDKQLTPRGLQHYEDESFGPVSFHELTPAFDFSPSDLLDAKVAHASAFHLLGTPEMCATYIPAIHRLRRSAGNPKPCLVVWEPEPRACRTTTRAATVKAAANVDVVSPNHLELRRLFEDDFSTSRPTAAMIEDYAQRLVAEGLGRNGDGQLVVRAAELGCMVLSRKEPARWFPAFYSPSREDVDRARFEGVEVPSHPSVVDPTGAGNAFLGAFTFELAMSNDISEACCRGIVAASFTLEQIAFPTLSRGRHGRSKETWNGIQVEIRLKEYKRRLAMG